MEVTQPPDTGSTPLQPLLHDLLSCVTAPALLLTDPDGQVRPGGVSGWYVHDVRLLHRMELSLDGTGLDLVRAETPGHDRQHFGYVARSLGDRIADPTVRVERARRLEEESLHEELTVISAADRAVDVVLRLAVGGDLEPMSRVKQGLAGSEPVPAEVLPDGLRWRSDGVADVRLRATGPVGTEDGVLVWRARLGRGQRLSVSVRLEAGTTGPFVGGRAGGRADGLRVDARDSRVRRTARRSLADLQGLLLADPAGDPPDRFLAAGSPWFLTMFGRDSLWAARMLAPADPDLVLSTLRALARRQGSRVDPEAEEEPGKILHEVRPDVLDLGEQVLPPVYYGTVDATPLWVCALSEAWQWGAEEEQVRALLPAAARCLGWMREQTRETGWIRYLDHSGHGLSNQGWKDSHDSVQFADGRLAEAPIALSEVQAYAWQAAVRGAALFRALGEEPPEGLDAWAAQLRERFVDEFWVDTPEGGHVAIALDSRGVRADSLTSNIGHVLGTGILGGRQAERVADLLGEAGLASGFGLRTLTADSPRFSVLSYHGGTVWPHDTAIAVQALASRGRVAEAQGLADGVFAAADAFDGRLPELYGGDTAGPVGRPTAYPAACRPQAWSAAAPLAILVAMTGLEADRDAGTLTHVPRAPTTLGGFRLRGLRFGEHRFDVEVGEDGTVTVTVPDGFPLEVGPRRDQV